MSAPESSSSRQFTTRSAAIPLSGRARPCSSSMTSTVAFTTTSPHLRVRRTASWPSQRTPARRTPSTSIAWVSKGTVINEVFEHASIPGTITEFFLGNYDERSPREKVAQTFLDRLTLDSMRDDCPAFQLD